MIDPITLEILREQDIHVEGYCLKCAVCGRVIEIVKDGEGIMSCCNKRMFVMSSNPPIKEIMQKPGQGYEKGILQSKQPVATAKGIVRKSTGMVKQLPKLSKRSQFRQMNVRGVPVYTVRSRDVKEELESVVDECDADFSPFNQAETQKEVEEDREKREKKVSESSVTFSPEDIEKARAYTTHKGYRKHHEALRKEKRNKLKSFFKHFKSEGFNLEEIEFLIREAEGMKGLPKGWTQKSLRKFSKSLTGKEGTKEGFFKKCVKRMEGKVDNPEGFCASVKDELHGSTYWRGKGKTPQEAGKDVKQHKNVRRG